MQDTDSNRRTGPKALAAIAALVVAALAAATGIDLDALLGGSAADGASAPAPASAPSAGGRDDAARVLDLFEAGVESDEIVEVEGEVVHLLPDDTEGEPHQRFLLELSNDVTLKISHNTRIAPRIDGLRRGDRVRLRGEYEWNDHGGVVHWTHRTLGRSAHEPVWIDFDGRRYE